MTVKLNGLAKKIKEVTRSMMAKVSELSMHQALAMNLFQEQTEKQALAESIKERLSQGEIPAELIERDLIRSEKMRLWQEQQVMEGRQKEAKPGLDNFVKMYFNCRLIYKVKKMDFTCIMASGLWLNHVRMHIFPTRSVLVSFQYQSHTEILLLTRLNSLDRNSVIIKDRKQSLFNFKSNYSRNFKNKNVVVYLF